MTSEIPTWLDVIGIIVAVLAFGWLLGGFWPEWFGPVHPEERDPAAGIKPQMNADSRR